MDIRIGITNVARELSFESKDSLENVQKQVTDALAGGSAQLTLTDDRGTVHIVPTAGIAYITLGAEDTRRVGFVA